MVGGALDPDDSTGLWIPWGVW